MKLTLAVISAVGVSAERSTTLTSLRMNAGRAARVDAVEAGHARRRTEIGDLAARVDGRRQDVAQEHPAEAAAVLREVDVPEILDVARPVPLRDEVTEVDVAADLHRRLAVADQRLRLREPLLERGVVEDDPRRGVVVLLAAAVAVSTATRGVALRAHACRNSGRSGEQHGREDHGSHAQSGIISRA